MTMRAHGREPMSMTHGDFDYQYLLDVVLDEAGQRVVPLESGTGRYTPSDTILNFLEKLCKIMPKN